MPLVATRGGASASALGWSSAPQAEELGGMVLLKPTSISYTGTSATISANGSVAFSACSNLGFNGVFSSEYDNYVISMDSSNSGSISYFTARLRSAGVDETSSVYHEQYFLGTGTTVQLNRFQQGFWYFAINHTYSPGGFYASIYGPHLNQSTAFRNSIIYTQSGATVTEHGGVQTLSTSYDGFSFSGGSMAISGVISIYGLVGA